MKSPHPALPWPTIDPDELSRTASSLFRLSATISIEVQGWSFRRVDWRGRSAEAHGVELDWIRAHAGAMPEAVANAAVAIQRLEETVRMAQQEIRRLAEAVDIAQANARTQQATADRAARAAASAPGFDPASIIETERLRQRADVERHRADLDRTEAAAVLRRAIAEASDLAAAVSRSDLLTAHQLDTLLSTPPSTLRSRAVHGSPPRMRHEDRSWDTRQITRTRAAIQHHVDALAQSVAELEAVHWSERTWSEAVALVRLTGELELHRRFLSAGRRMLDWDPAGDGRAIELFGDLTTAEHIAVVVPGIMNTIGNFDDHLARNARDLWAEASARNGRTAVIAWLGYDTPELLNAVSKGRAVEYESELRSFLDSLPEQAHVTVVAHSYGTVLVGEAASRGLAADDLVMVGSPGTRLHHATDADLEPGAQVYAGVSDTDYVVGRTGYGSIVCPEKALGAGWLTGLRWVISPVTGPLSWITDSCNTDPDGDVKGLAHGINPAHEDFGAIEITTDDVDGHSSYFDPDSSSLEAIAQIVTGSHPEQR